MSSLTSPPLKVDALAYLVGYLTVAESAWGAAFFVGAVGFVAGFGSAWGDSYSLVQPSTIITCIHDTCMCIVCVYWEPPNSMQAWAQEHYLRVLTDKKCAQSTLACRARSPLIDLHGRPTALGPRIIRVSKQVLSCRLTVTLVHHF